MSELIIDEISKFIEEHRRLKVELDRAKVDLKKVVGLAFWRGEQITVLKVELKGAEAAIDKIREERDQAYGRLNESQKELASVYKQRDNCTAERDKLRKILYRRKEENEQLRFTRDQLAREVMKQQTEINDLKTRNTHLNEERNNWRARAIEAEMSLANNEVGMHERMKASMDRKNAQWHRLQQRLKERTVRGEFDPRETAAEHSAWTRNEGYNND